MWRIEVTDTALKQLKKLGKPQALRITAYLRDRLGALDDPRDLGKGLKGPDLGEYWRYRVGDYRVLCEIKEDRLVVLVVHVGHRKDVYRSKS